MPEALWSAKQTAAYLGLTENAFRVRRHRGKTPPGIQLGPRTWRYRPAEVDAWLAEQHNQTNTRAAA